MALPIIAKQLVIRASKDLETRRKSTSGQQYQQESVLFVPCHQCFHFHREQRDPQGVQSPHHSLHVPQVGNLSLLRKKKKECVKLVKPKTLQLQLVSGNILQYKQNNLIMSLWKTFSGTKVHLKCKFVYYVKIIGKRRSSSLACSRCSHLLVLSPQSERLERASSSLNFKNEDAMVSKKFGILYNLIGI